MAVKPTELMQVTVLGVASSQRIVNVFHYRAANLGTFPQAGEPLGEFTDDFLGTWRTNILPLLHSSYVVEVYSFRTLVRTAPSPDPPPPSIVVPGDQLDIPGSAPTDQGGRTGEPLPTFAAVGVRKVSDKAGRRFRGNFRLGPLSEGDFVGNNFAPGSFFTYDTQTATFVNTILRGGFGDVALLEMCVFSETVARTLPPGTTDLYQTTAKVVGRVTNPFISSQVSRKQSVSRPT